MNKEKLNVFITDDIRLEDVDYSTGEAEETEFTENIDDFLRFVIDDLEEKEPKDEAIGVAKALLSQFEAGATAETIEAIREFIRENDALYDHWRDSASYEEQYQIPMMYAVRFFPSFCSFEEVDRYKTSGSTTLLYDRDGDRWGVGMTGGGMDLAPHLLDTFIQLGKGVPSELATSIRLDYNAYVNRERHGKNCKLLAQAFLSQSMRNIDYAKKLVAETGDKTTREAVDRHLQGLEKAMERYINIPF